MHGVRIPFCMREKTGHTAMHPSVELLLDHPKRLDIIYSGRPIHVHTWRLASAPTAHPFIRVRHGQGCLQAATEARPAPRLIV